MLMNIRRFVADKLNERRCKKKKWSKGGEGMLAFLLFFFIFLEKGESREGCTNVFYEKLRKIILENYHENSFMVARRSLYPNNNAVWSHLHNNV